MYSVSEEYIEQIKKPYAFKRTLRGTINNVSFTEDDILSGSFSVSNQCSDTNEVQIGSVYVGELQATFRSDLFPRHLWKGAVITISDGLWLDESEEYEYVPLGIYVIDDASIDQKGVKIKAYDYMLNFDKKLEMTTTIGSAYSILALLCQDCGVTLGMTKAQIEALPNGTQSLALYTENDCETYRDVLFWLAQTLCCFATIGRDGKLYMRLYGDTEIDSVNAGLRFDDNEFATYQTEYSGVGLTDIENEEYIYINEGADTKLPYNLGSNPFIQYGSGSVKKQMLLNILRQLKVIDYVPFSTSLLHCPAYDLGDVIQFTDGIADGTKHSCIMFYNYNFGYYEAEGYGSDPALANVRSKTDKEISGLMSKTDKNSIQFYTFKNSEQAVIDDGESAELINLRFTTLEAKQVTFQAEILCESEADVDEVIASIDYYLDNVQITDYQPTETWTEDGKHIISLYYMVTVEPNTLYQWRVRLNSDGGTITVPIEHARGTIWGTGLVALHSWNGFIDAEDTFGLIGMNDSIGIMQFWDMVTVEVGEPLLIEAEDSMETIDITDSITLKPFQAEYYIDKTSLYYDGITWGDIKEDLWATVLDEHVW